MKIQKLTINKYKAFQRSEDIAVGGKNVFIYGENGSGKSSVYYALKDFFQSSVENINMTELRNLYLKDGQTDCSIDVEFDGGAKFYLNETKKTTKTTPISDCNRLKSFITYKHLLGVHNVKKNQALDVFDLIINGVLKHFKSQTITNGDELGKLWEDVILEADKLYGKGQEFYFGRQKGEAVEKKAILFNNALNKLFLPGSPDYIGPVVNSVLKKLVPDLKIEFQRHNVKYSYDGEIIKGKILLEVENNGISLNKHHPHLSLNEAKLSAIGISIFLGAIKKQSPFSKEIKILFLDDILIGLDNENRLKLIKLLKEPEFQDFQIFITTYDRYWFEVAKLELMDWEFIEFYKGANGPVINPKNKTYIEKAKIYFDTYEYPECGSNLRKACEQLFKEKLLETYTFGEGIRSYVKPLKLDTLIDRLKTYYEDLGLTPPNDLISSLYSYKTILFNPQSHNDIESPIYKEDLIKAFKVIDDLQNLQLPTRSLLIKKGSVYNLNLAAINYVAQIEIAKNVYEVDNNGAKDYSPVIIFFKDWTREGVQYALPKGVPASAMPNNERLTKLKESPFTIEKATNGLNTTYKDRSLPEMTEEDILRNMTLSGNSLFDILTLV